MKKLLFTSALTFMAFAAQADEVLYPSVPTPEEVAQNYMMKRMVLVDPANVAPDQKTAMVSVAAPGGPLMRCTLTMQRSEVSPSKMDAAHWRISGLNCPDPAR